MIAKHLKTLFLPLHEIWKLKLQTQMAFRKFKNLLSFSIMLLIAASSLAQIPMNNADRFCFNELLTEDFGATIPVGWEGDFMITPPPFTEGWILQTGPSPDAPSTGADGAFSGSHYVYMETNGLAPTNSTFSINTPPIVLTDVNTTIRFRVLMHGSGIGQLKVNVLSGPGFTTSENVLTIVGEQHNSSAISNWDEAFIDVRQYSKETIKVEFEGMKMINNQGDIAIDLVQVCSEPRVPTMGEWGVICLGLFFLIFGVVALRTSQNRSHLAAE